MTKSPLVSIIVPCKEVDDYVRECVRHCRLLDYGNFEIILLPDDIIGEIDGVKVISTGSVSPGAKRNIGIAHSKAEFCAFIDSDAFPRNDWLKNALKYFEDPQVAGVGGPGSTPEEDGYLQKASGFVLSSFMVGSLSSRYKAGRSFESDDIHSCNFIVRKTVLEKVGGWNEKYWPGEDTLICLEIGKLGKKLVEASDVVVYHHRRSLWKPHLRQVSRFGLHRGFFAKKFPRNSLRLTFFVPSLLVLFFITGGLVTFINSVFMSLLMLALAVYVILCLVAALLEVKSVRLVFLAWLAIMLTHGVYGVSFLAGLMRRDLER